MIAIHRLTQSEYSAAVTHALGKGGRHAALLYSEYFKTGTIEGKDPAFQNAQALLKEMIALTDFSLPPLAGTFEAGETTKFLLTMGDGLDSESVVIPMKAGPTVCVSSQIGCGRGCAFCETGKMGLIRSLTAEEIVAQLVVACHQLGAQIRSVVFMGMGEPMDNLDEVLCAIDVMSDQGGLAIGRSHITVSTSGHVEGIRRLAKEGSVNLAVSVNAPSDAVRNRIMPINRRWDMGALKEAMAGYCTGSGKTILIEYVLLEGITDSLADAEALAHYLRGLRVKVNVIPYNPQRRDRFAPPTREVMEAFAGALRTAGYQTMLRMPKGQPIMAACGQLGGRKRPAVSKLGVITS